MIDVRVISLGILRNDSLRNLESFANDFQIISAIDKDLVGVDYPLVARYPRFNKRPLLTRGEVACALSHRRALMDFVGMDTKSEYCLFLEDDAVALSDPDFTVSKVRNFIANVNFSDYDFLHCGGMDHLKLDYYFRCRDKVSSSKLLPIEVRGLYRACAYVLNRRSALRFAEFLAQRPFVVADDFRNLRVEAGFNFYFKRFFRHPPIGENSFLESERRIS